MVKDAQQVLVCRLLDGQEMRGVAQAALEETIALVTLVVPPPREEFVLELHAPGSRPVVVLAVADGEPMGNMFPVRLRAFDDEHYGQLLAFVCASEQRPGVPLTRWSQDFARTPSVLRLDTIPDDSLQREGDQDGPRSRPAIDPLIGRTLAGGKYRIESLLGEGSAGAVYRSRHIALDKELAIKVLHPRFRADATFSRRFLSEARAASRLDHPNVTRVQDFGEESDGLLYIVMELLDGVDLRELLQKRKLPRGRKIDILLSVLNALAAADDQGIVHRDIKPENVVVVAAQNEDGDVVDLVKVCDFGLATVKPRSTGGTDIRQAAAAMSWIAGTPEYMSPEQILGENLDVRSDLYACGVILFEMLAGKLPFESQSVLHLMRAQLYDPPPALREIDPTIEPQLERLTLRALSKERDKRPTSPREFRNDLRAAAKAQRSLTTGGSLPGGTGAGRTQPAPAGSTMRPGAGTGPAQALPAEPAPVTVDRIMADVDGVIGELRACWKTPRALVVLRAMSGAIPSLLQEGALAQVAAMVTLMAHVASQPTFQSDPRHELCAQALSPLRDEAVLAAIGTELLTSSVAQQNGGRDLLLLTGPPGAKALLDARRKLAGQHFDREAFTRSMRAFGASALPLLTPALEAATHDMRGGDLAFVEDLLGAMPESNHPDFVALCQKLAHHGSAGVRRAAVARLPQLLGAASRPMLRVASRDPDESVRIAALGALRTIGAVDAAVVALARDLLTVDTEASVELRIAVANALQDVVPDQKDEAIVVLKMALRPKSRSIMNVLRQTVSSGEDVLVLEAIGRVLVAMAGDDGKREVERRVVVSKGELRVRLELLLREE